MTAQRWTAIRRAKVTIEMEAESGDTVTVEYLNVRFLPDMVADGKHAIVVDHEQPVRPGHEIVGLQTYTPDGPQQLHLRIDGELAPDENDPERTTYVITTRDHASFSLLVPEEAT